MLLSQDLGPSINILCIVPEGLDLHGLCLSLPGWLSSCKQAFFFSTPGPSMPHQKNGFQLRHLKKAASFHRQLGWEVKRDAFQFSASQEVSLPLLPPLPPPLLVVPKLPPSSALYARGFGGF